MQIVRSVRDGETVRQQVIANLGRREQLVASGELDGLLRSLARFSEKLRVVEAARTSGTYIPQISGRLPVNVAAEA